MSDDNTSIQSRMVSFPMKKESRSTSEKKHLMVQYAYQFPNVLTWEKNESNQPFVYRKMSSIQPLYREKCVQSTVYLNYSQCQTHFNYLSFTHDSIFDFQILVQF